MCLNLSFLAYLENQLLYLIQFCVLRLFSTRGYQTSSIVYGWSKSRYKRLAVTLHYGILVSMNFLILCVHLNDIVLIFSSVFWMFQNQYIIYLSFIQGYRVEVDDTIIRIPILEELYGAHHRAHYSTRLGDVVDNQRCLVNQSGAQVCQMVCLRSFLANTNDICFANKNDIECPVI